MVFYTSERVICQRLHGSFRGDVRIVTQGIWRCVVEARRSEKRATMVVYAS